MAAEPTLPENTPSLVTFYRLEAAHAAARAVWLDPGDDEALTMARTAFAALLIDYDALLDATATARKCSPSHARAVVADRVRVFAEAMWIDLGKPELDGGRAVLDANVCPDTLPDWMTP